MDCLFRSTNEYEQLKLKLKETPNLSEDKRHVIWVNRMASLNRVGRSRDAIEIAEMVFKFKWTGWRKKHTLGYSGDTPVINILPSNKIYQKVWEQLIISYYLIHDYYSVADINIRLNKEHLTTLSKYYIARAYMDRDKFTYNTLNTARKYFNEVLKSTPEPGKSEEAKVNLLRRDVLRLQAILTHKYADKYRKYLEHNDIQNAITYFEQYKEKDNYYPIACHYLCLLYQREFKKEKSAKMANKCLDYIEDKRTFSYGQRKYVELLKEEKYYNQFLRTKEEINIKQGSPFMNIKIKN